MAVFTIPPLNETIKGTLFDGLTCPLCNAALSDISTSSKYSKTGRTIRLSFKCGCYLESNACPNQRAGTYAPILVAIGAAPAFQPASACNAKADIERANRQAFNQLGVE